MNIKQIIILMLIILVIVGGYLLFFPKSVNHNQVNVNTNVNAKPAFDLNNNVQVKIRDMTNIPVEYYSGNSRFSHGQCQTDVDCQVIGCSLEMCSSDPNLMTTCEILSNTPDKSQYACGCIKDRCGWYRK